MSQLRSIHNNVDALKNIPAQLRNTDQWGVWKHGERDNGKTAKIPFTIIGNKARTNVLRDWSDFSEAIAALKDDEDDKYDGIGFLLSDHDSFAGIDIDDCVTHGAIDPEALEILRQIDSYAEISPSGRGIKIFLYGDLPANVRHKLNGLGDNGQMSIEVYDSNRFFTVTGCHVSGTPRSVEQRQSQLEQMLHGMGFIRSEGIQVSARTELNPREPIKLESDETVLSKARNGKRGSLFSSLFDDGDISAYDGDQSSADLALCNFLAYWTGGNERQIDKLFRRSKMMRPKWDEKHFADGRTYGQATISKSLTSSLDPAISDDSDQLIVDTDEGIVLAGLYLKQRCTVLDQLILRRYRGDFYRYDGHCYRSISEEMLAADIYSFLEGVKVNQEKHGRSTPQKIKVTSHLVAEIKKALPSRGIIVDSNRDTPVWLDNRTTDDDFFVCNNGIVDLEANILIPSTPMLFCTNSANYDFNAEAAEPRKWMEFLESIFGDDIEAVSMLQEWFGYCLTANASQQKIMLIVGPTRSGKGTIGRVLTGILGNESVAGPTLNSLCTNFGLQSLLGKKLAIISDARLSSRGDQSVVTERLLSISGEDSLNIDRKFQLSVTAKLTTRFMIFSNELPRLTDSSGALANRFIILKLTRSFLGRENTGLAAELLSELPAILNWAIKGLIRLNERGYFMQPQSSQQAADQMMELTSPVKSFVAAECIVGSQYSVEISLLYEAWRDWCNQSGWRFPGTIHTFGRDLHAALPDLTVSRPTVGGERVRKYRGVALKDDPPSA